MAASPFRNPGVCVRPVPFSSRVSMSRVAETHGLKRPHSEMKSYVWIAPFFRTGHLPEGTLKAQAPNTGSGTRAKRFFFFFFSFAWAPKLNPEVSRA